jgi:hypothetical protein
MSEPHPVLALEPFPAGQRVFAPDAGKSYLATRFRDHLRYAPALIAYLLELARQPPHREHYGRHLGGTKLYDPGSWAEPAGAFLDARALAFYRRATGREGGRIAQGWANVYSAGDYIVPHSHTEADFSLVYVLDAGDEDAAEPTSGRFCFADPRWALCCQVEPGRLSNTIAPPMHAGSMILFPAEAVHFVHPYLGQRPRLTLSWNLRHA